MSNSDCFCAHLNSVICQHEGCIVCQDCGVVLSSYFENEHQPITHSLNLITAENKWVEEIKNILDRIHIPIVYAEHIFKYFQSTYTSKNLRNLMFSIYYILNKFDIPISLNELAAITNTEKTSIYKAQNYNENLLLNYDERVEKYCSILNLTFKMVSLIKETIKRTKITGHPPLTIIAAIIYKICKTHKLRISMKKISQITNISCISIQRYNKNSQ